MPRMMTSGDVFSNFSQIARFANSGCIHRWLRLWIDRRWKFFVGNLRTKEEEEELLRTRGEEEISDFTKAARVYLLPLKVTTKGLADCTNDKRKSWSGNLIRRPRTLVCRLVCVSSKVWIKKDPDYSLEPTWGKLPSLLDMRTNTSPPVSSGISSSREEGTVRGRKIYIQVIFCHHRRKFHRHSNYLPSFHPYISSLFSPTLSSCILRNAEN